MSHDIELEYCKPIFLPSIICNRVHVFCSDSACLKIDFRGTFKVNTSTFFISVGIKRMLHMVNGPIAALFEQQVVVDCGAISLAISVPSSASFAVGQKAILHTYMHWNAENGPSLFGFANELDRTVFLMIISCSGLGPKIGLAILADLGTQAFLEAVHAGNDSALTKVSGIGAKKAEQMVVQLKHKVAKLLDSGISLEGSSSLEQWQTVSQVLQSLNYSRPEITAALKYLNEQQTNSQATFDQLMRQALSFLAKRA